MKSQALVRASLQRVRGSIPQRLADFHLHSCSHRNILHVTTGENESVLYTFDQFGSLNDCEYSPNCDAPDRCLSRVNLEMSFQHCDLPHCHQFVTLNDVHVECGLQRPCKFLDRSTGLLHKRKAQTLAFLTECHAVKQPSCSHPSRVALCVPLVRHFLSKRLKDLSQIHSILFLFRVLSSPSPHGLDLVQPHTPSRPTFL